MSNINQDLTNWVKSFIKSTAPEVEETPVVEEAPVVEDDVQKATDKGVLAMALDAVAASGKGENEKAAEIHGKAADAHDELASDADDDLFAEAHDIAADAHRTAEKAHKDAIKNPDDNVIMPALMTSYALVATQGAVGEGEKPVAKGDVAGHPFHGNQYTTGSGGSEGSKGLSYPKEHISLAGALANRAMEVLVDAKEYAKGNGIDKSAADAYAQAHDEIADEHRDLAEEAKAEGFEKLAAAHEEAADAHDEAAKTYVRTNGQRFGTSASRLLGPANYAQHASLRAFTLAETGRP